MAESDEGKYCAARTDAKSLHFATRLTGVVAGACAHYATLESIGDRLAMRHLISRCTPKDGWDDRHEAQGFYERVVDTILIDFESFDRRKNDVLKTNEDA